MPSRFILFLCFSIVSTSSQALPLEQSFQLGEFLEQHETTGEQLPCLDMRRLRGVAFIDDKHLLFKFARGRYFINSLPEACSFHQNTGTVSFNRSGPKICATNKFQIISTERLGIRNLRAIETSTPFCELGMFETITNKPGRKNTDHSVE